MYTHVFGYKFCIRVDANGYKIGRNKSINVDFWPMSGEFDDNLKWPARAQFTIELINHRGGDNVKCTRSITWERNTAYYFGFTRIPNGFPSYQHTHSLLTHTCILSNSCFNSIY